MKKKELIEHQIDRPGDNTAEVAVDVTNPQRLLLNGSQAAWLLSMSKATFYVMNKNGQLGPEQIRGMKRWSRFELEDWVRAGCPDRRTWRKMREPVIDEDHRILNSNH